MTHAILDRTAGGDVAADASHHFSYGEGLVCVVLAAAFTLFILQWTMERTQLCVLPPESNLPYLSDALWRVNDLYGGGPARMAADWVANPPASPTSCAMAIGGYTLFGLHDWSPYAANGILILGLLIVAVFITRDLPLSQRALLSLVILTAPVCMQLIQMFRPEASAALAAAAGATLLLAWPTKERRRSRYIVPGLLFGLALITDRTYPRPVILLFFLAALGHVISELAEHHEGLSASAVRKAFAPVLLCVCCTALVAVPYLLVARNTRSSAQAAHEAASTAIDASSPDGAPEGVVDPPRRRAGAASYLLLWCLVVGGTVAAARGQDKRRFRSALALAALAVLSFGSSSLFAHVAQPLLLVFAALYSARFLLVAARPWLSRILLLGLLIVSISLARFPDPVYAYGSPIAAARREAGNGVFRALHDEPMKPPMGILVTARGAITRTSMIYRGRREEWGALVYLPIVPRPGVADFTSRLAKAQFVIAGGPLNDPRLPPDPAVQMLESNADFKRELALPVANGESYFLYRRVKWTPQSAPRGP